MRKSVQRADEYIVVEAPFLPRVAPTPQTESMRGTFSVIGGVAILLGQPVYADVVHLTGGGVVRGSAQRVAGEVVVRVDGGVVRIPHDEVLSLTEAYHPMEELIAKRAWLASDDFVERAETARWAIVNGLPAESRILWEEVLAADPSFEEARLALGLAALPSGNENLRPDNPFSECPESAQFRRPRVIRHAAPSTPHPSSEVIGSREITVPFPAGDGQRSGEVIGPREITVPVPAGDGILPSAFPTPRATAVPLPIDPTRSGGAANKSRAHAVPVAMGEGQLLPVPLVTVTPTRELAPAAPQPGAAPSAGLQKVLEALSGARTDSAPPVDGVQRRER